MFDLMYFSVSLSAQFSAMQSWLLTPPASFDDSAMEPNAVSRHGSHLYNGAFNAYTFCCFWT